jgi:hypothetical protein
MPYQERHLNSASDFLCHTLRTIPSCPHLSTDSVDDMVQRSLRRPDELSQPTLLPYIARLRAAFLSSRPDQSIRLHDAVASCAAAAALRYEFAHRPARSDLVALLADGLLSAARSGAYSPPVLAASLAPIFATPVEPDDALLALEVLAGAIQELTHFCNPLLGFALAQAHVNLLGASRRLDDDTLQDVMAPSLLPLLAVSASTVFSPGTSVVSPEIAPHVPSLETPSRCGKVHITTSYAPTLTTTIVLSAPHQTRVRLDRDTFNCFASLFLLSTTNPVRALNLFRFSAEPVRGKHLVHIAGRVLRLDPHVVRSLQQTLNDHFSHPTHRAWSNYRAGQMGDF